VMQLPEAPEVATADKVCHLPSRRYGFGMYSVPDLIRDASETLDMPRSDLSGRMRAAREEGLVSQKAHGRGGANAVRRDLAVLLLAPFVSKLWQDVPDGVRRYGGLVLSAAKSLQAGGKPCDPPFDLRFEETPMLDALTTCLERCSVQSGYLPASLRLELSETHPAASISLKTPDDTITLFFDDPSAKKNEHPPYSIAVEIRGEPLCDLLELFAAKAGKRPGAADGPPDAAIGAVA
jgi:hypothetical protein